MMGILNKLYLTIYIYIIIAIIIIVIIIVCVKSTHYCGLCYNIKTREFVTVHLINESTQVILLIKRTAVTENNL